MIKRYRHINIGMLTTKSGDWVKYDDIAHLLEEKTIEQHRAEFEMHCSRQFTAAVGKELTPSDLADMRTGDCYGGRGYLNGMWDGWKAARGVTE